VKSMASSSTSRKASHRWSTSRSCACSSAVNTCLGRIINTVTWRDVGEARESGWAQSDLCARCSPKSTCSNPQPHKMWEQQRQPEIAARPIMLRNSARISPLHDRRDTERGPEPELLTGELPLGSRVHRSSLCTKSGCSLLGWQSSPGLGGRWRQRFRVGRARTASLGSPPASGAEECTSKYVRSE
jgi:hypothetical protein